MLEGLAITEELVPTEEPTISNFRVFKNFVFGYNSATIEHIKKV